MIHMQELQSQIWQFLKVFGNKYANVFNVNSSIDSDQLCDNAQPVSMLSIRRYTRKPLHC